jgi:DNA-binding CsgD family transcriptional regulator
MAMLLERVDELAAVESAARAVAGGTGVVLAVTGRAGVGKTRLLDAALDVAAEHQLNTSHARAGQLEEDLGWGVAVEVLEGLIGEYDDDRRRALLSGRARAAATVLEDELLDDADRLASGRQAAIVAALTVVAGRIAADRPVAVIVDDVHWADAPSLRWLCHLAARTRRMPVLLIVAFRPLESGSASDFVGEFEAAAATTLRPAPLTASATAEFVGIALDGSADASTSLAVYEVTGGVPLLIEELVRHLRAGPLSAAAVREARPAGIAALITPRLARLGATARALCDAVAILGVDAPLRHAAEVAGIERAAAALATARLVAAGLFADGLPLNFAHPLVREVIKDGLGAAPADELRRRAARMLAEADADPVEAALHLLAAEPVGRSWAGDLLIAAGHRAMGRAAYESAASFFGRALDEPASVVPRREVCLHHGRALLLAGRVDGVAALGRALDVTPRGPNRAGVALEVGAALMAVDRPQQAVEVYERGLDADGELAGTLRIELLAQRALASLALRDEPGRTVAAVADAMAAASGEPGLAGRSALGLLGIVAVWMGNPADHCTALFERALAAEPYGGHTSIEWTPDLAWVMAGLSWCDAYTRRDAYLDAVIDRGRERGATLDVALAVGWRSYGRMRLGRVADAAADALLATQIYEDLDDSHRALVTGLRLDPLLARGALAEADRLLVESPPHDDEDQIVYLMFLDARARLRIAQGRLDEARADLELLQSEVVERGFQCPGATAWRPQLAVVLHALGADRRGRALALEDLEHARGFGAPRTIGLALLATAAVNPPAIALPSLVEAVELLAGSPAQLEYARALVALGALNRRLGNRGEASEQLRRGLDRAARCGASALVVTARSELKVVGGRPRRERIDGPESLTAAERRVAELAAAGTSNAEIARALVVTLRTVETHLTSTYRKLDIRRRDQLAEKLDAALGLDETPVAGT